MFAVLGVAGILGQEILKPGVFWYNAGLPENIPDLYFGGPSGKVIPAFLSFSSTSSEYLNRGCSCFGAFDLCEDINILYHMICRLIWEAYLLGSSCSSTGLKCEGGKTSRSTTALMRIQSLKAIRQVHSNLIGCLLCSMHLMMTLLIVYCFECTYANGEGRTEFTRLSLQVPNEEMGYPGKLLDTQNMLVP